MSLRHLRRALPSSGTRAGSLALAVAGAVGWAAPAAAHAHLTAAIPAAGGTAAAPAQLVLQFTEGLELRFSGVAVTGPDDAAVATGPGRLGDGDPARLTVPVTGRLVPGAYTVEWHAVATDGHRTAGHYRFTVAP
ncbi:copper homeostasis periplasmic binding protein CopC [Lichenibacterium ramalinae]|uniref:Cu resistance protein n=1 Tax=Lichenibacterium ramalinae TaxID=2316527 RepID=A0A4Q2RCB4_9HYPH|nr:copper homeostasis periplasmic binding protein CopC [Lichenibacterium ramalinae]RYB03433.1 Cu resistance protein [Lichenibacterium ramalinae]